jgi:hypothetical protein
MKSMNRGTSALRVGRSIVSAALALILVGASSEPPAFQVRLEVNHPWRPPFGLDRVGRPIVAVVETGSRPKPANYLLTAVWKGKKAGRYPVQFPDASPHLAKVPLPGVLLIDQLLLTAADPDDANPVELVRQTIPLPDLEADAIVRPDTVINPVDLGTILVPSGWLLLGPKQAATLEFAAINRGPDMPKAQLSASFDSAPALAVSTSVDLSTCHRVQLRLKLPDAPPTVDRDVLTVALQDVAGRTLWRKGVPVMLVQNPPRRPRFGATYERLRYDAPISVREPRTGKFSSLAYNGAWEANLRDVVVWFPNGARFVFWRGSSYIPFWAGRHNTGLCTEWAEIISQPEGAVDCVEPLMDKTLRFSRVEIVESTTARVHVRWSYQSTDFNYKVWGDEAVEDYTFYPDGFGTRVVNLKSDPKNDYELSEFIVLTPQGAYPFDVLPNDPVDALFIDGRKHPFRFPNPIGKKGNKPESDAAGVPAIYRLRLNKEEELAAVYFNPNETKLPPVVFAPFFDKGEMVTPCYWGSHWPLARGNSTGNSIDDRIQFTPCHNSVMSWGGCRPIPLRTSDLVTLDTLGRARPMTIRRWAWLIGMTDLSDSRLVEWAKSFSTPLSFSVNGARLAFASYSPERRSIGLDVTDHVVRITTNPGPRCVNPVFEFHNAPPGAIHVGLRDQPDGEDRYAWDGRVLWLDTIIESPALLVVRFGDQDPKTAP